MSSYLARTLYIVSALIAPLLVGTLLHAQSQPTDSDLEALRFYLREENQVAVSSEIRRLQQTFPGWEPPENLDSLLAESNLGPTIDRIYRLIAQEQYQAARDLIAQTEEENPSWAPPQEMTDLIRISEAQGAFDTAVEREDAQSAIGIARGIPELISCDRVNNAWLLADMYMVLDQDNSASQVYRGIVRTCSSVDILVATLEKANEVVSLTELAQLSDLAQNQSPSAAAQIRTTEDRLRAGRGEPARWSNGDTVTDLDNETLASIRPEARPPNLGRAPSSSPTRTSTSSPTTTVRTASSPAPAANLTRLQAAAQRGAWRECLQLSNGRSSPEVVYQRGWCAFNADRPLEAIASFKDSRQRLGSATQQRDASYGLMLSLLRMNMTEEAAAYAAATHLTNQQRREVEAQILDQRGVRAYESGQYGRAVAFFNEHQRLTGVMRRDLELLRGYALLNDGHREEAKRIFQNLHNKLATPETRQALRAAR